MSGEKVISLPRLTRLPDDFWQRVMAAPWRYDLFQLLRRLDAQGGQRYPLGRAPLPKFESVRIGQTPSLAFAPATVASATPRDEAGRHELSIYSFGLFGPNGPLPTHLTEYVHERIVHHQDHSLSAFADLFHHRATLLFYRAGPMRSRPCRWIARRQSLPELSRLPGGHRFTGPAAGQFAQPPCPTDAGGPPQPPRPRCRRAGAHSAPLLWRAGQADTEPAALADAGQPRSARLGAGRHMPRLGASAFLGVAVRDVQHRFRLHLGPLSAAQYARFLPDAPGAREVRDWVRHYLGIEMQWDLSLILAADEVQGVTLGGTARLGYTSWLGHAPQPQDREDFMFEVEAASR